MSTSFAAPWTVVCQALLSMGLLRQEYWSGLPFPSLGDLPDPGMEPASPALAGRFFTTEPPGNPQAQRAPLKYPHTGGQASGFTVTFEETGSRTPFKRTQYLQSPDEKDSMEEC